MENLNLTEYSPKTKEWNLTSVQRRLLRDEIVPLTAEDKEYFAEQQKTGKGCAVFFAVIAVIIISLLILTAAGNLPLHLILIGVTALAGIIIVLTCLVMNRLYRKQMADNKKRIIVTTVEELTDWTENRRTTYYATIKVEPKNFKLEIDKKLYEQLKEGDIVELHTTPEPNQIGTIVRELAKVADAPPENPSATGA